MVQLVYVKLVLWEFNDALVDAIDGIPDILCSEFDQRKDLKQIVFRLGSCRSGA
jgi:hypothetical protein